MVWIENRMGTPLPTFIEEVLKVMFAGYQKFVVKSKFTTGSGGSHVFLGRPIRQDGTPELPSVVKIDHHERIKLEWQAYKSCIQNRLPGVAEISGEPVYPQGSQWGGLRYPLVGSGTFDVVSFHTYYHQANTVDICYVLEEQLFKRLDAIWRHKTVQPEMYLNTYYDSFLPPNLIIEWSSLSPASTKRLDPEKALLQTFHSGEVVQIVDFRVVRLLPHTGTLVLDDPSGVPTSAYRFQVTAVPHIMEEYEVGQVIKHPLMGIIRQTRDEQLREQVTKALGPRVDVTAKTLTLANGTSLPNPLLALRQLLHHSLDNTHIACIHADLNLENILVEPQNRNAYLIDFVNARQDHVLRDLLHLEMAIVTRLIPEALTEADLDPEIMIPFYEQLHCVHTYPNRIIPPDGLEKPFAVLQTIRRVANHYLSELGNWSEYYYGLIFYLLGALRYKDLDETPMAKQTAFWGAAATQKLLEASSSCAEILAKQESDENIKVQQEKKGRESTVKSALYTETKLRYQDSFSSYEIGTQFLLLQMERNDPLYLETLGYQDRLRDNINRSRRFGDTSLRKADRAEIVEQLNELALSVTGVPFDEIRDNLSSTNESFAYAIAGIRKSDKSQIFLLENQIIVDAGVRQEIYNLPPQFKTKSIILPNRDETAFQITIHAEDMRIESDPFQTFIFNNDRDSPLVEFILIPLKSGTKYIWVEFLYKNHWLAKIVLEVTVS